MLAGVTVLHLVIGLELGFEGLLETGGSLRLEQLVRWGRVGCREKNVAHIRHHPERNHQVRLTIVWSSPLLQNGHHPPCNRASTLTAATGRCISEPFASVIGAKANSIKCRLGPEHRTSRAQKSIKKHAFKAD